jgi:hypothetical protein
MPTGNLPLVSDERQLDLHSKLLFVPAQLVRSDSAGTREKAGDGPETLTALPWAFLHSAKDTTPTHHRKRDVALI